MKLHALMCSWSLPMHAAPHACIRVRQPYVPPRAEPSALPPAVSGCAGFPYEPHSQGQAKRALVWQHFPPYRSTQQS